MADPVGEFSFKHTGNMLAKTDDGQVSINANWEGEATGYGGVFGTLNITQPLDDFNNKSGTCSWVGQGFLDDGTTVGGLGEIQGEFSFKHTGNMLAKTDTDRSRSTPIGRVRRQATAGSSAHSTLRSRWERDV